MENEHSIKVLRLVTGEDIIADTVSVAKDDYDDHHMQVYNPLKIVYMNNPFSQTNRVAISLMHWVYPTIVDDQTFKLYTHDIITTGLPSAPLLKHYTEFMEAYDAYHEFQENTESWEETEEFREMQQNKQSDDELDPKKLAKEVIQNMTTMENTNDTDDETFSKLLNSLGLHGKPKGTIH